MASKIYWEYAAAPDIEKTSCYRGRSLSEDSQGYKTSIDTSSSSIGGYQNKIIWLKILGMYRVCSVAQDRKGSGSYKRILILRDILRYAKIED